MSSVEFAYVDVFAAAPLSGAPLTLVTDADGLTREQMQAISREFNQSETTFIQRPTLPGATRRLRSFTPTGEEVLGAGHNALGAWLWLATSGQLTFTGEDTTFRQQIGNEVLPVVVTAALVVPTWSPWIRRHPCSAPRSPPEPDWPKRSGCNMLI